LPRGQHSAPMIPEQLLEAIAQRHGFRTSDYSLVWDGGDFDPSRAVHELTNVTGDGWRAIAQLSDADISRRDPWKYLGKIESGFRQLAQRGQTRGV